MKNLQQIINELKVERSNAMHGALSYEADNKEVHQYYLGRQSAFEQCISELNRLLKYENEKSSQSSQEDTSNSSNAM